LGYKDLTIFSSVILEAITICLTAVIAGLVVTLSLVPLMESMSDGMLEDTISVTPSVIIGGFFIGIIIAFMSAAVPAYQALRLKVVDALREG
jgi:ABC-type antimicrobial peptide transport system permease subunit